MVVPCGGAPYGDESLVFIANDWHTSLLPVYLQAHYRDHGKYTYARSILVIHNIAHQGRGPMDDIWNLEIPSEYVELFRLYDPVGGEHMNIMKVSVLILNLRALQDVTHSLIYAAELIDNKCVHCATHKAVLSIARWTLMSLLYVLEGSMT